MYNIAELKRLVYEVECAEEFFNIVDIDYIDVAIYRLKASELLLNIFIKNQKDGANSTQVKDNLEFIEFTKRQMNIG